MADQARRDHWPSLLPAAARLFPLCCFPATHWLSRLFCIVWPSRQGVVNGNYRCSYLGFDLNRHWLAPSAWAQPEIFSVKNLVTELHEDPSIDLDFYVGELGDL